MNNKRSFVYLILVLSPLFAAYRGPEATENKNKASASLISFSEVTNGKYEIDKDESVVTWKCSMAFADKGGHNGFVSLSKGVLTIEKGQLAGGTFEVDMNTIADEHHRVDNNLVNHLKKPDFFDVKQFPFSTFTITRVAPSNSDSTNVTGNLTIKGITHEVTFPANINVKGRVVYANGKVTIDRTQWDVRYRSGKFFDNLADNAISDDIEFEMTIVAKK
jgi:polyisoprenoid-binding protein YceI